MAVHSPARLPSHLGPARADGGTEGAGRPSEVGLLALSPTADGGGGGEDDDHCKSRLTGGEDRDGE